MNMELYRQTNFGSNELHFKAVEVAPLASILTQVTFLLEQAAAGNANVITDGLGARVNQIVKLFNS